MRYGVENTKPSGEHSSSIEASQGITELSQAPLVTRCGLGSGGESTRGLEPLVSIRPALRAARTLYMREVLTNPYHLTLQPLAATDSHRSEKIHCSSLGAEVG